MSSEIQIGASLAYTNVAQNIAIKQIASPAGLLASITGKNYTEAMMSVPTTAGGTAIPVSNLGTVGWAFFKNNDATNYVDILTAVSGTAFARLLPGEFLMLRFCPSITAPAALAHTLAVVLEYLILEI